jgi:catechol 2,3-dioxygenase
MVLVNSEVSPHLTGCLATAARCDQMKSRMITRHQHGRLCPYKPNQSILKCGSGTYICASLISTAISFYTDVLGFGLVAEGREIGIDAAFLAAGDYHHHVGLNTWESSGGTPLPPGHTGLYHVAFVYPDRHELARAVTRLLEHRYPIDHGTDHSANVSVYLADPDGNGIELYYDRPREEWFDADGRPILKAEPFDPLLLVPAPSTGDPTAATSK